MKVTVIIPFAKDNPYLRECLRALEPFINKGTEVILLPDGDMQDMPPRVRIIPTGSVGPSVKRDRGAKAATGEILAFLDDDAYPDASWLDEVPTLFADPDVGGVGGPAVTPPGDGFWAKSSGLVYESPLGGGPYAFRYKPGPTRRVDDFPTCNLLVRAADFKTCGGFDTAFWPGEDTKLCLELVHTLGRKMIYHPRVLVYHHRRALVPGHFRQVTRYALHRGYFAKRFPKTSLRFSYFLPTFFTAGLLGLPVLAFFSIPMAGFLAVLAWVGSAGLSLLSALWVTRNPLQIIVVAVATIATHLAYGIYFVAGLLAPRLEEESK